MSGYGPIHTLIVHVVGDDDEPFHINDFEDCEIQHPAECKQVHDEVLDADRYECGVSFNLENVGLRFSLRYTGTPITEPGTYRIQAWAETIRGFDYTEYDGGIGVVEREVAA